jgi:3-hydroxyacyl-CoA dehydrogenase
MSQFVEVSREGEVAVVAIDNPPVNALSFPVREGLHQALTTLAADAQVKAIVLACKGRTFVAGADITEFGKPARQPTLRDLIVMLESIPKPTIAALHGTALGGGLEIALACTYRVGVRAAKAGLPEVKLGLIPGAGGTVRLPYLIGADAALPIIVSGNPVGAEEALSLRLFDAVVDGEVIAGAVAFARKVLAAGTAGARVRDRQRPVAGPEFEALAASLAKKARGLEAPLACIQAVRNAVALPFDAALEKELEIFRGLMDGEQSRAQRHLFFAERQASKVTGVTSDTARRNVRRVGVIGAGTMGGGIAMAFANGGFSVTILEPEQAPLDRGLSRIVANYTTSVQRGSLTEVQKEERLGRIATTTDYAALGDCDLIIEAVFEEMAIKKEVFGKLDKVAKPGAILASNTSYLNVDEIAAATGRPGDVLGLHFFSPANVMKLLEIVRGKQTAPDVLATALHVCKAIGKTGVVVGVCHGFVGNRMLGIRNAENEALLLEGASPEQIDAVYKEFGWPMGAFEVSDLAGLDIGWRNRKALGKTAVIADALCEAGRYGQKTGKGWYRYEGRAAIPDSEVAELIARKAGELGIARRSISRDEIIERTLYPLVNEGAKVLEEQIAERAGDIDVVWCSGYGFPIYKGGPMFWAQSEGLAKITAGLERWHRERGGEHFQPAKLLVEAAERGIW